MWIVEHADRDDVFTQAADLDEARRNAVEVLALADVDEADIGHTRFVVDGPITALCPITFFVAGVTVVGRTVRPGRHG